LCIEQLHIARAIAGSNCHASGNSSGFVLEDKFLRRDYFGRAGLCMHRLRGEMVRQTATEETGIRREMPIDRSCFMS